MSRRLAASLVLAGFTVASATHSAAVDRSDKPLKVSPSEPVIENSYGPLIGNDPQNVLVHPEDCKISPACDSIPLVVDIPEGLLYRLILTTSWAAKDVEDTAAVPDVDVYFWEETITIHKHDDGTDHEHHKFEQIASAASSSQPEVAKLADLTPTSASKAYYVTPVNFAGDPIDYKVKVEYYRQFLPERRQSSPAPRRTTPVTFPEAQASKAASSPSPSPTLSPSKTPGPTGERERFPLVAVGGESAKRRAQSRAPLIFGTLGLLVLGGSLFTLFFLRGRRRVAP